jgi:hypothetical protein
LTDIQAEDVNVGLRVNVNIVSVSLDDIDEQEQGEN